MAKKYNSYSSEQTAFRKESDYLGLFSFVLHFEYYSTELEDFFFCPLSQPLAKVIQFHQAFLDLHALSAHLFFLPLCQICFDKGP